MGLLGILGNLRLFGSCPGCFGFWKFLESIADDCEESITVTRGEFKVAFTRLAPATCLKVKRQLRGKKRKKNVSLTRTSFFLLKTKPERVRDSTQAYHVLTKFPDKSIRPCEENLLRSVVL